MARSERIYVPVTSKQMVVVKKLMEQENKPKAQIAAMVFSDGLKLVESELITVVKNDLDGK